METKKGIIGGKSVKRWISSLYGAIELASMRYIEYYGVKNDNSFRLKIANHERD